MQSRDTFEHSGAPETSFHAATPSCAAERTFSALKRVKTVGRSTMGEGRLESLLLMEIHKRIHVDAAAVVKMYLKKRDTCTR